MVGVVGSQATNSSRIPPTAALLLHGISQAGAQLQDHLGLDVLEALGERRYPFKKNGRNLDLHIWCAKKCQEKLDNPDFADLFCRSNES